MDNPKTESNAPLMLLAILVIAIVLTCIIGPVLKLAIDSIIYCNISPDEKGSVLDSIRTFAWEHLDYKKSLNQYDFAKIVRRILEITFVIFLLLFARKMRLFARFTQVFSGNKNWKSFLAWGFLLGCFSLGLYVAILSSKGIFYFSILLDSSGSLPGILATSLLGAIIIGVLEEIIFRATILQMFMKKMNAVLAVILSSTIYSLLHFCKSDYYTGAGADVFIVPKVLASFFSPLFNDPFGLSPESPFLGIIPETIGLIVAGLLVSTFFIQIKDCFFLLVRTNIKKKMKYFLYLYTLHGGKNSIRPIFYRSSL